MHPWIDEQFEVASEIVSLAVWGLLIVAAQVSLALFVPLSGSVYAALIGSSLFNVVLVRRIARSASRQITIREVEALAAAVPTFSARGVLLVALLFNRGRWPSTSDLWAVAVAERRDRRRGARGGDPRGAAVAEMLLACCRRVRAVTSHIPSI